MQGNQGPTLGFLVSLVKEFKYGLKWKTFYCKSPEQAGCKTSAAAWRRRWEREGKSIAICTGIEVRHRVDREPTGA